MDRDRILRPMGDSRSLVEPLVPDEPQDADLDDAGNPDASRGHVFETRAAVSEGYRSDTFEEPPRRARHSLLSADYDYVPGETGLARAHYQRMRPPSPPSDRPWNQRVFSRISHRKQGRTGRKARAFRWRGARDDDELSGRVAAYCTCDVLHTDRLMPALARVMSSANREQWSHNMYHDTVHSFTETKSVFFMTYGCIVCWGLTEDEESNILSMVKPFEEEVVAEVSSDDLSFEYGDKSRVYKDTVVLQTHDPAEKLAVSFAMAQSVKLSVFEARVAETIADTKHIPQHLSETGKIGLSQLEISKQIGALFIERNLVNLHSDMLDTPDYFWDSDEFEPTYQTLSKYLDVSNRVDILNRRLDIIRELLDMLNDQLNNQHASKLEWIVIWLIVIEVVIDLLWNVIVKDVLGFFPAECGC